MVDYFKKFWIKGFDFKGKTSRKEYWMTVLTMFLASFAVGFVLGLFFPFSIRINYLTGEYVTSGSPIGILVSTLWYLAIIIPSLSMSIRRLHDIGKTGWWIFIVLLPIAGSIIYFVFLVTPGVETPVSASDSAQSTVSVEATTNVETTVNPGTPDLMAPPTNIDQTENNNQQ